MKATCRQCESAIMSEQLQRIKAANIGLVWLATDVALASESDQSESSGWDDRSSVDVHCRTQAPSLHQACTSRS